MRIQQLPDYLANQIAAGEVVERPASVVKELLENSLDAQATYIELEVEQGGLKRIRITDNGKGIHKEDLLLALYPHATSKLGSTEDLFNIQTLGFRGEALASISSIARLQLTSSQTAELGAWRVTIAGGSVPQLSPAAHPLGTTVVVEDLFFNTPARRKFLRSDKAEFNQLEEVFKRIVLSNYLVSFSLKYNQRLIYQLPAAADEQAQERRVSKIFGKQFLQHALRIEFEIGDLRLWGWIGLPTHTRSQADLQYVYLNGRVIRDKVVNHAVRTAYEDKIYPGRYPLFLLYLEIEPHKVDVNVHPTKHEVRFHDSRLVHDFIYQSILTGLSKQAQFTQEAAQACFLTPFIEANPQTIKTQASYQVNEPSPLPYQGEMSNIGRYEHYLLARHPRGLLIIDLFAALFIEYFLQLQQAFLQKKIATKALLIPVVKNLSSDEIKSLEEQQEILQAIGLQFNLLGTKQLILRALPATFNKINAEQFLTILCQLLRDTEDNSLSHCLKLVARAASQATALNEDLVQVVLTNFPRWSAEPIGAEVKFYRIMNEASLNKLIQHSSML